MSHFFAPQARSSPPGTHGDPDIGRANPMTAGPEEVSKMLAVHPTMVPILGWLNQGLASPWLRPSSYAAATDA
jgi:hypothetical protein